MDEKVWLLIKVILFKLKNHIENFHVFGFNVVRYKLDWIPKQENKKAPSWC